jgi:hypothetical protein
VSDRRTSTTGSRPVPESTDEDVFLSVARRATVERVPPDGSACIVYLIEKNTENEGRDEYFLRLTPFDQRLLRRLGIALV